MKKILFSIICLSVVVASNTSCQSRDNGHSTESQSDVVTQNILSRRSVRQYAAQQVGRDTVDIILQAGINAPSAMNKQPWEVRVIRNSDLLAKINALNPDNRSHFYDAPTLIIVANDTTNVFSPFDAGLFSQNVMLSAESFGLGTVALGMVARDLTGGTPEANAVLAELKLSENYQVIIGIALGYKAELPAAKPRDAQKVKIIE
ncbi:MAG: nitroreductase [Prevotellaceae bacterium]|jgi:nitroreductase|nr:nitroreductase [Prevotellaceae bacterium]